MMHLNVTEGLSSTRGVTILGLLEVRMTAPPGVWDVLCLQQTITTRYQVILVPRRPDNLCNDDSSDLHPVRLAKAICWGKQTYNRNPTDKFMVVFNHLPTDASFQDCLPELIYHLP